MKRTILIFAAAIATSSAWAQMPELEPSPELKKMSWMMGEWSGTGTFVIPDVPEMDVTISFKAEWDGQFLKQTAINDFGMMQMTETMLLGYDPDKAEYVSYGFSNIAPKPRIEHGKLNGDALVMVSEPWSTMGQEPMVSRSTMTKVDDDTVKMKLEFKMGDNWTVVTDMTFKRKKA